MITVAIEADDDDWALAEALSALVPAAADGFVREVLIADRAGQPGVAAIADALGAAVVAGGKSLAIDRARSDWVLVLAPGVRLEADWHHEARGFIEKSARGPRGVAAVFAPAVTGSGAGAFLRYLRARFLAPPGALLAPRETLKAGGRLRLSRLSTRAFAKP